MAIAISASRGRVKYPILTRIFQFGSKELKLKKRLYNLPYPIVDMQRVVNAMERNPDWDMTKTQLKAILNHIHHQSILIRTDTYFDGMVDMVVSNPNAEFAPMTTQERDMFLDRICHANSRYRITFNKETREIEAWSLAVGGFTLKLDPEQFSDHFNGRGL